MAQNTPIEWTDKSWNPLRGCSRISEGCRNCYAEKIAARFSGDGLPYNGLAEMKNNQARWTGKVIPVYDEFQTPLKWRKPSRIFVNSMSDMFHESVEWNDIYKIFEIMMTAKHHTYQILTKRAERMAKVMPDVWFHLERNGYDISQNKHIWLGVSVEDQKNADERIPCLLHTPAAIRFLSVEPLLSEMNLIEAFPALGCSKVKDYDEETGELIADGTGLSDIDWVIVGGESGHGARPCNINWIRTIIDQCKGTDVPCFVKQLGSKPQWGIDNVYPLKLKNKKGGDIEEWDEYLRVREFPKV